MHLQLLLLSGSGTRWAQLLVALSILILLHEGGHYFFAKLFKTRVEKFYLFFDFLFPFGGLFNFSLFKKKVGDTEYGIGWFPLGGYVKIAGMVDESMDKEQLAKPPEPWEYRSKPAWQRLFIMLGGIIFNILVAMIVYSFVFGIYGEKYLPSANAIYGVHTDSTAKSLGFRDGDKIVAIGGKPVDDFNSVFLHMLKSPKAIEVERAGGNQTISLSDASVAFLLNNHPPLFEPRIPTVVHEVIANSEAKRMGLMTGDSVISLNNEPITFFSDFQERMDSLKKQPIRLVVWRNHSQYVTLTGITDTLGHIGFSPEGDLGHFFQLKTIHYNPIQAIGKGVSTTFQKLGDYASGFRLLFKKGVKLSNNLGGFGTFSKIFPTQFDMEGFLKLLAFISIVLAFMNLLPIPGLDGGYVVFTLWEMITGKKVSDKVMEVATTVGLVLLLALMLYANGLDVFRYFKK